jgi:O-methyltransferase
MRFFSSSRDKKKASPSALEEALAAIAGFDAKSPSEAERAALFDHVVATVLAPNHQTVFWGDRLLTLDKAQAFLQDPKFKTCFESIRGYHLYDQYQQNQTIAWRLHTLVWAARCAVAHSGDFVECGVFKGDMAWTVVTLLGDAMADRTFYLYDSFEGFDLELSRREDYPDNPNFLDFANRVYQEPGLFEAVSARFKPFSNVRIVRGYLPGTLERTMPEKIAFLHVDLNSPAAEIAVLDRLFDRVVPGGLIIFDDYGWHLFRAQREAEDRFMADRGYAILELPTGQGLVVKR